MCCISFFTNGWFNYGSFCQISLQFYFFFIIYLTLSIFLLACKRKIWSSLILVLLHQHSSYTDNLPYIRPPFFNQNSLQYLYLFIVRISYIYSSTLFLLCQYFIKIFFMFFVYYFIKNFLFYFYYLWYDNFMKFVIIFYRKAGDFYGRWKKTKSNTR